MFWVFLVELNIQELADHLISQTVKVRIDKNRPSSLISQHTTDGLTYSIRIDLSGDFPWALPNFHLVDRDSFGSCAHVAWGKDEYADICIGSDESFSTNFDSPELVLSESLQKAVDIVSRSLTDPTYNKEELRREFVGVWRFHAQNTQPRGQFLGSLPKLDSMLSIRSVIKGQEFGLGSTLIFNVSNNYPNKNAITHSAKSNKRQSNGKGCFITIVHDELLPPPAPNQSIKNWWRNQLDVFQADKQLELQKLARQNKSKLFYLLLGLNIDGQQALVGIKFESKKRSNAPLSTSYFDDWSAIAFNVDLISKENLLPRSGGDTELATKNICIIGCGSVGGFIADTLASSGVGKLTLCDPDQFKPENLHRHILPASRLYDYKATALAEELLWKYPFLEAKGKTVFLQSLLDNDFLSGFDAIIVATGNVSLERKFNRYLLEHCIQTPIIYTWLEAMSVGGHAIACQQGKPGCLECTYLGLDSFEPELHNNLNFIEAGQEIIKSHAGCGTEFLPYSTVDSRLTATLSSRVAIKVLNNGLQHGIAASWRGDSSQIKSKKIELTHRYYHFEKVGEDIAIQKDCCHACG